MNNLNDPPRWNVPVSPDPGRAPAADGNQWNYFLLVPMLGLAAFRWIWSRESQREIQNVKAQYNRNMSTLTSDLEDKYRDSLTENRRTAALLELELEKERQRVVGYRQALIFQSQQIMEERKELQRERVCLEQEKRKVLESGVAGAVLRHSLDEESEWHRRASATLKELEGALVERQSAYCTSFLPRAYRLDMEKNLLLKVAKEPLGGGIDLETDLKDIFEKDWYCADRLNTNKRKNGSLMWVYLRYWQLQVTMQKHKKAEDAIMGTQANWK